MILLGEYSKIKESPEGKKYILQNDYDDSPWRVNSHPPPVLSKLRSKESSYPS